MESTTSYQTAVEPRPTRGGAAKLTYCTLRQSRSDLVHEGKLRDNRPPINETCKDALALIRTFFKDRYGIDLSYSIHPHPTLAL